MLRQTGATPGLCGKRLAFLEDHLLTRSLLSPYYINVVRH